MRFRVRVRVRVRFNPKPNQGEAAQQLALVVARHARGGGDELAQLVRSGVRVRARVRARVRLGSP